MFPKTTLPMEKALKDVAYTTAISKFEQREIEKAFARLFSSEDGKRVLAYLQVITFNRVLTANTSDDQLRHVEGQRALVASILRLIDRGRN